MIFFSGSWDPNIGLPVFPVKGGATVSGGAAGVLPESGWTEYYKNHRILKR